MYVYPYCFHSKVNFSSCRCKCSKMEGGLLSLKWNNHKSTFFHVLSNVRKKASMMFTNILVSVSKYHSCLLNIILF